MKYIDVHCHLQFEDFDEGRDGIIEEMKHRHIAGIVVGVDKESSEKAVELAEKHAHLFATVGLHPNYTKEEAWEDEVFRRLAEHPKVVALGECGLDYFRPESDDVDAKDRQESVFRAQLSLAQEVGKPVMVHARPTKGAQDAYHDTERMLGEYPDVLANMHFFVGGVREVDMLGARNASFSYPGIVTYAREYDASIQAIPRGRILTETDCPYASPAHRRGERNDPLSIPHILKALAEVRTMDEEAFRVEVAETAKRVFAIPDIAW